MSRRSNESDRRSQFLRREAESRLRAGSAPPSNGIPLDREALTLLYEMASDPKRSSDALRLLQELQVHQVELDLQREELENNEREMSRDLALYKTLFELTPIICVVATMEGRIIEANPASASLMRTRRGELPGRALHEFLQLKSHTAWTELLQKLNAGELAASCEVRIGTAEKESTSIRLSGSFLPEGNVLLFGVVNP